MNYLYLGRTSLYYAAYYGQADTVKILLKHGADVRDVSIKNGYGVYG